jgi:hypothetical protein
MSSHWSDSLVDELKRIDAEQAPHGLYGLRDSRRASDRLPKLLHILEAPPIRLFRRLGVAQHTGRPSADYMSFGVAGGNTVLVDLVDYADTKVRQFGDSFRLDKHTSIGGRPLPDLRTRLPRLGKRVLENHGNATFSFGILLIAHFSKERDLRSYLEPFVSPEFLLKHGLRLSGDSWLDVHGRGFFTSIHLWYVEQRKIA